MKIGRTVAGRSSYLTRIIFHLPLCQLLQTGGGDRRPRVCVSVMDIRQIYPALTALGCMRHSTAMTLEIIIKARTTSWKRKEKRVNLIRPAEIMVVMNYERALDLVGGAVV